MTITPEKIDALILAAVSAEYAKIAVVISKVFDALEARGVEKKALSHAIADRLYILVDNGALGCKGNMRRWRDAEIWLPKARN